MNGNPEKTGKIGYLSGPVDGRKVYEAWQDGTHTELLGTSYLTHWFKEVSRRGREGVVITTHDGPSYEERRGDFTIINRPTSKRGGLAYHLDMFRWMYGSLEMLEHHGASTTVLTIGPHYRAATLPFRKRGMRFINAFHGALRPPQNSLLSPHELLHRLSGFTHLAFGDVSLVASLVIQRQLANEPGASKREVYYFVPDYSADLFRDIPEPRLDDDPVEVMFAGRVIANKGVFDFLRMCEIVNERSDRDFHFHVYGDGPDLENLKRASQASPCANKFTCHGFMPSAKLVEKYAAADLVVVPTRAELEEGFAMSVLEGVLALRPTITSKVCPALEVVADACMEAEPDNPHSYADAILRLTADPKLLQEKVAAARRLREDYFDPPNGYDRQLRKALEIAERPNA